MVVPAPGSMFVTSRSSPLDKTIPTGKSTKPRAKHVYDSRDPVVPSPQVRYDWTLQTHLQSPVSSGPSPSQHLIGSIGTHRDRGYGICICVKAGELDLFWTPSSESHVRNWCKECANGTFEKTHTSTICIQLAQFLRWEGWRRTAR